MMRQDLNDLYFFAQVVRHGGFAPAGRVLGYAPQRLVASPELLQARGRPDEPGDLAAWPGLGYGPSMDGHAWVLQRADGEQRVQPFEPRLVTSDMLTLCKAALSGMGVVQLPEMLTREYLQQGL